MHTQGELTWWDSYWRESYKFKKADKRHSSILLHGGGVWKSIPFILEWDSGNIPLSGIRRRARKLAHFLGARQFSVAPEFVPALVMVSTTWMRAILFMDYYRQAAYATGGSTPPIYAASISDLMKHGWGTRTWLQMGTGLDRGYLFQNAGKRLTNSFPGDLEKRIRQIYLDPLPDDPEKETGARRIIALVQQTSPAEKRILRRVASLPLASNKVLSVAGNLNKSVVKQGIEHLERSQLIKRIAPEGTAYAPRYAHLARMGMEYMAAVAGSTLKAYAEDRNYRLDKFNEPNVNFLIRNMEHLKAVYEMLLHFSESATEARDHGWHEYLSVWDGEVDARRQFRWQGRTFMLYPDSFGIYVIGHKKFPFFIEVERTVNRSVGAIEKKLKTYRNFIQSGAVNHEFRELDIYLLLIGKKRGQLERWRKGYNRIMGQKMHRLHLRLTTLPELRKRGATGVSWLDERNKRTYPFLAPSDRPDSARMQKTINVFELNQRVEKETIESKIKQKERVKH